MKHFEKYFTLLQGYNFATPQDRENALWAAVFVMRAKQNVGTMALPFRPPLVAIIGPSRAGKTHLAQRLGELISSTAVFHLTGATFNFVAAQRLPLVRIDDVALKAKNVRDLSAFVTSEEWSFRRQKVMRTEALNCVTVITCAAEDLPPDLKSRALIIRLLSRVNSTKKGGQ